MFHRFKDMDSGMPIADDEKDHIMHASLPIGDNFVLMASDCPSSFGGVRQGMLFRSLSGPKAKTKQHVSSTACQPEARSKCRSPRHFGELSLECSLISSASTGWSITIILKTLDTDGAAA